MNEMKYVLFFKLIIRQRHEGNYNVFKDNLNDNNLHLKANFLKFLFISDKLTALYMYTSIC